ncbi:MAG: NfeD family protein [Burkholderiales bacterium]|nr:NfeD family protein [Burkholderiales bacterium]
MGDSWIWWVLAGVLVGAELVTGTFYLLAVAVAFAVGGVAAFLGVVVPLQLVTAGIVAVVAIMVAHRWRQNRAVPQQPPLDLGQAVKVLDWKDDHSARVAYRGSQWDAELAAPDASRAETMYIVGTRGSVLLIADRRTA